MKLKLSLALALSIFVWVPLLTQAANRNIPGNQNPLCQDSDNGKNFSQAGVVTLGLNIHKDICLNRNTVREYFCNRDQLGSVDIRCQGLCKNGACLAQDPIVVNPPRPQPGPPEPEVIPPDQIILESCQAAPLEGGRSYVLTRNFSPQDMPQDMPQEQNVRACFTISNNNITLNCRNHSVQGVENKTFVRLSGSNATVKNCHLMNFDVGIDVESRDQSSSTIQNNEISSSNKGLVLFLGRDDQAIVESNRFTNNQRGIIIYKGFINRDGTYNDTAENLNFLRNTSCQNQIDVICNPGSDFVNEGLFLGAENQFGIVRSCHPSTSQAYGPCVQNQ